VQPCARARRLHAFARLYGSLEMLQYRVHGSARQQDLQGLQLTGPSLQCLYGRPCLHLSLTSLLEVSATDSGRKRSIASAE
jgi:hypothetical protein